MNKIKYLFLILLFCASCTPAPEQKPEGGFGKMISEFRILDSGQIVITRKQTISVLPGEESKGLLLRFPTKFKDEDREFGVQYKVKFARRNGKDVKYEESINEGRFWLAMVDKEFLKPGDYEFFAQLEVSGYNFKGKESNKFFWEVHGTQSRPIQNSQTTLILPKTANPQAIKPKAVLVDREKGVVDVTPNKQKLQTLVYGLRDIQAGQPFFLVWSGRTQIEA